MAKPGSVRRAVRCAIYTRKSTEDGLEQDYNSLDAQRDACAAYIASQRHEGWIELRDDYDDGGFSGGTMERPALRRLLDDIANGRVDVIVIYKVDRLTRSLADFAKIVDVLDAARASFVSVTQSFNTTSSMGRLTLNMLLSFAQFEREVTGERIRDKIAASKRKGLWMGGPVPLGYEVHERKLVVYDEEACLVRHIFQRYLELPSVAALADELNVAGYRTKVQSRSSGPHRGGCSFRRGTLYHLLSNRIYRGAIVHKGEAHPGEHDAIIDESLWDAVQAKLERGRAEPASRSPNRSVLTGKLSDGLGRAMTPTHATKGNRRYRYYVTRPEATIDLAEAEPAWRITAHDLECIVANRITAFLADGIAIGRIAAAIEPAKMKSAIARAASRAADAKALHDLADRVQLGDAAVTITIALPPLLATLGLKGDASSGPIVLTAAVERVRKGHQLRLVVPGDAPPPERDMALVKLLADAFDARELVAAHRQEPIHRIAAAHGRCRKRLSNLHRLSYLAPDIVIAILDGVQPPTLTPATLLAAELPLGWADQKIALGFA